VILDIGGKNFSALLINTDTCRVIMLLLPCSVLLYSVLSDMGLIKKRLYQVRVCRSAALLLTVLHFGSSLLRVAGAANFSKKIIMSHTKNEFMAR